LNTGALRSKFVVRHGLLDGGMDMKSLEKFMSDPKKMEEMKKAMDELMNDPAKKKALEDYSASMQANVAKLKADPEMKPFFEDIEKNGLQALDKWQNNDAVLRKFSQATGGVAGMPGMDGLMQNAQQAMGGMAGASGAGAASTGAASVPKPGDEVIINGLAKAPELNGRKAMVVPPTPEEMKSLEGTGRMIVRLMDSGEQFAVKPSNLRTTKQEADNVLSKNLEDVSVYNPALQTQAAKLRESGKLDALEEDPELKPIFEDIKKNGMAALEKYWNDEKLMAKISKAMAQGAGK